MYIPKEKALRVPTQEDFDKYSGGHTFKKWSALPPDWRCPACKRSKFQLLTWTKCLTGYGGILPGEYQWLAPIHEHHDHRSDNGIDSPRFAPTLICGNCNSADASVKRRLRLPSQFSFSPSELGQFVTGYPHDRVTADPEIAKKIYAELLFFLGDAGTLEASTA